MICDVLVCVIWVFLALVGFVAALSDHAKYPKSDRQALSPYLFPLIPNVCMCIYLNGLSCKLYAEAWAGGSYGAHVSNLLNHESQSMKAITWTKCCPFHFIDYWSYYQYCNILIPYFYSPLLFLLYSVTVIMIWLLSQTILHNHL